MSGYDQGTILNDYAQHGFRAALPQALRARSPARNPAPSAGNSSSPAVFESSSSRPNHNAPRVHLPRLTLLGILVAGLLSPLVHAQKPYTLGMIAKSSGNPFFEAARAGANDAARDLGKKHGIAIRIDWRTPHEEDAQKQAEFIEQLLLNGADGIIISCSDAKKVTDTINKAVAQGVPVATFGRRPGEPALRLHRHRRLRGGCGDVRRAGQGARRQRRGRRHRRQSRTP